MQKLLLKFIDREMPAAAQTDRDELAQFLCGREYQRSSQELATLLMQYGQTPCSLLTTLMRCENLLLRHPRQHGTCLSCDGSLKECICYIERCSELRLQLLAVIRKSHFHAQLNEEQLQILRQTVMGWAQDGYVQLHNYFNEMPVTARVEFHDSETDLIEVTASREAGRVFASGRDMQHAYTATPDRKFVITLGLHACRQGRLKLAVRAIEPAVRELRTHLRVALEEPYAVTLNCCGQMVQAQCHDLSLSGMGLVLDVPGKLPQGGSVACSITLNGEKLFFEALVCWTGKSDSCRLGLKFVSLGPFDEAMRQHIMTCQQQLVQKVRKLSLPMWARPSALSPLGMSGR